ncbi:hypothetical protein OROHE_002119 [Orobanche hederae]
MIIELAFQWYKRRVNRTPNERVMDEIVDCGTVTRTMAERQKPTAWLPSLFSLTRCSNGDDAPSSDHNQPRGHLPSRTSTSSGGLSITADLLASRPATSSQPTPHRSSRSETRLGCPIATLVCSSTPQQQRHLIVVPSSSSHLHCRAAILSGKLPSQQPLLC